MFLDVYIRFLRLVNTADLDPAPVWSASRGVYVCDIFMLLVELWLLFVFFSS